MLLVLRCSRYCFAVVKSCKLSPALGSRRVNTGRLSQPVISSSAWIPPELVCRGCPLLQALSVLMFCLQGMNFLAGLLLLAMDKDCVKTFWMLVVLLEQVCARQHCQGG